jgi:hypothetical protein
LIEIEWDGPGGKKPSRSILGMKYLGWQATPCAWRPCTAGAVTRDVIATAKTSDSVIAFDQLALLFVLGLVDPAAGEPLIENVERRAGCVWNRRPIARSTR